MTVDELRKSNTIIYEFLAGSHAYGLNTPESDEDIRGIFINRLDDLLNLNFKSPPKQIDDENHDISFYSLKRFFELAKGCNPNVIEFLWIPDECVKVKHPLMQKVIDNRHLFISKEAYNSFSGYSFAQLQRARGQNKWINNPKPKDPPKKEDFCWIIDTQVSINGTPCRPVKMIEKYDSSWLNRHHAAALEHTPNMYRLYYYGDDSKGVFRNGQLVVESIPFEDEFTKFNGLLIYNEVEYDRALKDWKGYWDWIKNRNEYRWVMQEKGMIDYDRKSMYHTIRLLISSKSILENGNPIIRMEGANKDFLMKVRNGNFSYDELMLIATEKMTELKKLVETSKIPEKVDEQVINELYLDLLRSEDYGKICGNPELRS